MNTPIFIAAVNGSCNATVLNSDGKAEMHRLAEFIKTRIDLRDRPIQLICSGKEDTISSMYILAENLFIPDDYARCDNRLFFDNTSSYRRVPMDRDGIKEIIKDAFKEGSVVLLLSCEYVASFAATYASTLFGRNKRLEKPLYGQAWFVTGKCSQIIPPSP